MTTNPPLEILAQGKFMRLVREGRWEYAERNRALGAVVIVPVTAQGELVLVEQHRVPMHASVIELPAGLVGDVPGEPTHDWSLQARRELLEETGFEARRVKFLSRGPVSAGFGSEVVDFYLAGGLVRRHAGGGVDHENIRVHVVPLDRVPAWLKRQQKKGLIVDQKIYAGLYFAHSATAKNTKASRKPALVSGRRTKSAPRRSRG